MVFSEAGFPVDAVDLDSNYEKTLSFMASFLGKEDMAFQAMPVQNFVIEPNNYSAVVASN